MKFRKEKPDLCDRSESQVFTKQMTKGQNPGNTKKCKHGHCGPTSFLAWCDLKSKEDILKLHDKCPNTRCICNKQIIFTPRQNGMEGAGLKKKDGRKELTERKRFGMIFLSQWLM